MWVIVSDSQYGDEKLFLVDRTKVRKKWWTLKLNEAVKFRDKSQAEKQISKIYLNRPKIVTLEEALSISDKNKQIETLQDLERSMYSDHPFSSDALGQW